ncbi:MAG: fibronectin type III domain-containing protein, partial [Desulfobacteraceae bacterium]|nr:fibronectin type III domain-containing protein [Desulfobacteraceae bacterium]
MNRKYVCLVILLALVLSISACTSPSVTPAPGATPESTPSQMEADVQPPDPPTNLVGEPISQHIVSLQWSDNANNEDGYRIYRDGSIISTVQASSTNFRDIDLEVGKQYRYSVRAFNEAGESEARSCTVKTLNPPLNVTINHIGVLFDHDPIGPGDIRLVLLITDGKQTVQQIIPPLEGTFPLSDYETIQLDQRVFHTVETGDFLKIGIIAYDDDPESAISDTLHLALPILGTVLAQPYLISIANALSEYEEITGKPLFENKDDYVGYYEGVWGSDESWGIGQYNAVGMGDFRVWFSIWSDSEPAPISQPTLAFMVNFDGWYVEGSEV